MTDIPQLPPPLTPAERRTGVDGRLLPLPLAHEQKMTAWFRALVAFLKPRVVPALAELGNYANDAAAATGGVPVGGIYRNGSVLQIRVS